MDALRTTIHSFFDNIFNPFFTFLSLAQDKLAGINSLTSQGLNLSKYLTILGDLPTAWQLVVQSLFISVSILGSLLIFRSVMRLYYALKESIPFL